MIVPSATLYGGYEDMRIRQEMMLGIGGMRALRALGIVPTVCHMNEGHSSFLGLERIRTLMQEQNVPFPVALHVTSAGNVFTTHTSVPAGIDMFPIHLMDQYLTEHYRQLGISREQFLYLGQRDSAQGASFSMANLALRLADHVNGVSRLHGQVAREMWKDLWPLVPVEEVPIISITNGVHPRSIISRDMADLYLRYLGPVGSNAPGTTRSGNRWAAYPTKNCGARTSGAGSAWWPYRGIACVAAASAVGPRPRRSPTRPVPSTRRP